MTPRTVKTFLPGPFRTFLGLCSNTSLKRFWHTQSGMTVTSAPVSTLNVTGTSRVLTVAFHRCPSGRHHDAKKCHPQCYFPQSARASANSWVVPNFSGFVAGCFSYWALFFMMLSVATLRAGFLIGWQTRPRWSHLFISCLPLPLTLSPFWKLCQRFLSGNCGEQLALFWQLSTVKTG